MSKHSYIQIQKGDLVAEVIPSAVRAWKRNGWTVVDDESSEVPPNQVQEKSPTELLVPEEPAKQHPLPDKTKE